MVEHTFNRLGTTEVMSSIPSEDIRLRKIAFARVREVKLIRL